MSQTQDTKAQGHMQALSLLQEEEYELQQRFLACLQRHEEESEFQAQFSGGNSWVNMAPFYPDERKGEKCFLIQPSTSATQVLRVRIVTRGTGALEIMREILENYHIQ